MSPPQIRETDKQPSSPVRTGGIFRSVFLVWCSLILVGAASSGKASAAYGAFTPGAMFGIAGIGSSVVAAILAISSLKDWRSWTALGLCLLAVVLAVENTPHGGGP